MRRLIDSFRKNSKAGSEDLARSADDTEGGPGRFEQEIRSPVVQSRHETDLFDRTDPFAPSPINPAFTPSSRHSSMTAHLQKPASARFGSSLASSSPLAPARSPRSSTFPPVGSSTKKHASSLTVPSQELLLRPQPAFLAHEGANQSTTSLATSAKSGGRSLRSRASSLQLKMRSVDMAKLQEHLNASGTCFPCDRWIVKSGQAFELTWHFDAPLMRARLFQDWLASPNAQVMAGRAGHQEHFERAAEAEQMRLIKRFPDVSLSSLHDGNVMSKEERSELRRANFLRSHPSDGFHVVNNTVFTERHQAVTVSVEQAVTSNVKALISGRGPVDPSNATMTVDERSKIYNRGIVEGPAARLGEDAFEKRVRDSAFRLHGQGVKGLQSYAVDHESNLVFLVTHSLEHAFLHWQPETSVFKAVWTNFFNFADPFGYQISRNVLVKRIQPMNSAPKSWFTVGELDTAVATGVWPDEAREANMRGWLSCLLMMMRDHGHDLKDGSLAFYDGFVLKIHNSGRRAELKLVEKPQNAPEFIDLVHGVHSDPLRSVRAWSNVPTAPYSELFELVFKQPWQTRNDNKYVTHSDALFEYMILRGKHGDERSRIFIARNDSRQIRGQLVQSRR